VKSAAVVASGMEEVAVVAAVDVATVAVAGTPFVPAAVAFQIGKSLVL